MPQTPVKFGTIPNSARLPAAGSVPIGAADPGSRLMVTLRQRRRPGAPLPLPAPGVTASRSAKSRNCMSREDYAQQHGAAAADFDAVKAFATVHGLTVAEASAGEAAHLIASSTHITTLDPASSSVARLGGTHRRIMLIKIIARQVELRTLP
jgi:hypothetical protein